MYALLFHALVSCATSHPNSQGITPPTSRVLQVRTKQLNQNLLETIRDLHWAPLNSAYDAQDNLTQITAILPSQQTAKIAIQKLTAHTQRVTIHVRYFGNRVLEQTFFDKLAQRIALPERKKRNKYFTLPKLDDDH